MAVEVSEAVVELQGRVCALEAILNDPIELLRRALGILSNPPATQ